jgi:hypothetical protein
MKRHRPTLRLDCDGVAIDRRRRGATAIRLALLFVTSAALQALPALANGSDAQSTRLTAPLACADFARRSDGAWVPQRPFTTEGVNRGVRFRGTYGINTVIRTGVAVDGIDLGALLDRQCAPH